MEPKTNPIMIDPEDLPGTCLTCGGSVYIVRPGSYQCDTCDDLFCRGCGWHHRGLVEFCDEYECMLDKYEYDESELLKQLLTP